MLTSRQDITRVQSPERFVHDLVTVLGADPAPWLVVLGELQRPAAGPAEEEETGRPRRWPGRRIAIVAGVCLLGVAGVVVWPGAFGAVQLLRADRAVLSHQLTGRLRSP